MGLFTGLLTLPLAPVRGAVWVMEQVVEEADRQLHDPASIRRDLLQLELDYEEGRISPEEHAEYEERLLERLALSASYQSQADEQV